MLNIYLSKLGFSERERKIYVSLIELGVQPSSVIANRCKYDRVTTYKNLKKLAAKGFVKMYSREGVQCFGIESFDTVNVFLKEKVNHFSNLLEQFNTISEVVKSRHGTHASIPRLQIFEGETGVKNFFRDILFEIKRENLKQIRMFASNTFEAKLGEVPLSKFISDFFSEIKKQKIAIEIFEAVGAVIPERLCKVQFAEFDPGRMPAARGTTNIFLAGSSVYLACYKATPIGLKITQAEMSQIFHFLFDLLGQHTSRI